VRTFQQRIWQVKWAKNGRLIISIGKNTYFWSLFNVKYTLHLRQSIQSRLMQKFSLIFMFCLFAKLTTAQVLTISDANFSTALLSNCAYIGNSTTLTDVDSNDDGQIQETEAAAVTALFVPVYQIEYLDGLSYFLNLKTLVCNDNLIVDLAVQSLTQLEYLNCSANNLSGLNLLGLTNLRYLDCSYNHLNTLNLQGLASLETLNCNSAALSSINIQGLVALRDFVCRENYLQTINLQGLMNLRNFDCGQNNLQNLDLENLTSLQNVDCSQNQLTALSLQGLTQLDSLICNDNLPLTTLNVQGLSNLKKLWCRDCRITSLNVQSLTQLQELFCDGNPILTLNVQGLTQLRGLYCVLTGLTSLDLTGLTNLRDLSCSINEFTSLDVSDLPNLRSLSCSYNTALTSLYIKNGSNESTYLSFTNNPNLTYICCDATQLTAVQAKVTQYGYTNCVVDAVCSVNAENADTAQELYIQPNPVADILTLKTNTNIEKYEIFDNLGRNATYTASAPTLEINVSHLPKGVYFIKTYSKNSFLVRKFVKN
jgi:Leucine-rich repeat (LRR) protein